MSIASEVQRIRSNVASAYSACAAKGSSLPAEQNTANLPATIVSIGSGGPPPHPCNLDDESENGSWLAFVDYDGTPLFSYTMAEAAALAELPPTPDHSDLGLVNGAWNWTLADVATAVDRRLPGIVGPQYDTSDGKSWFLLEIPEDNFTVYFNAATRSVSMDWGDGSAPTATSTSATATHVYALAGSYVAKVTATGAWSVGRGGNNRAFGYRDGAQAPSVSCLRRAYLDKYAQLAGNAFFAHARLEVVVTSPDTTCTYYNGLNDTAVRAMIVPKSATNGSNQQQCAVTHCTVFSTHPRFRYPTGQQIYNCRSLMWWRPTLLRLVTANANGATLGNAHFQYVPLRSLRLPHDCTGIGNSGALANMYALRRVVFSPDPIVSFRTIGTNAFSNSSAIEYFENFDPTQVTTIGDSAFANCWRLFPDGIAFPAATAVNYRAFQNCRRLAWFEAGGANCAIGNEAFSGCVTMSRVSFSGNVSSIGTSAFASCRCLCEIDLSHCTAVPTLANTNAFTNCTALARILVPSALLADWSAAENWATYASKLVGVTST